MAHGVETTYETGKRAARRLRVVRDAYRREFGANWSSVASKGELKRIKKVAEHPFKKKQEFFSHIAVYVMINIMLWSIYLFGGDTLMRLIDDSGEFMRAMEFPWPAFVTLGWGIGVVFHALEALTAGRQERAIEREMERERMILESEKPKRAARGRGQLPGADEDLGDFDIIDEPVRERRSDRRESNRGGIRLTEDGELTESMIVEIEDENERQRRTRR